MARRSEYAEQVGEWIRLRRAQLGMTQRQLAQEVGDSERTIRNAEAGSTSVAQLSRPAWEQALGWPPGSLTAAYRRGQHPETRPAGPVDPEQARALTEAGIPPELYRDPGVSEVLDAGLPAEAAVTVLRAWYAQHVTQRAFLDMLDDMRRRQAQ